MVYSALVFIAGVFVGQEYPQLPSVRMVVTRILQALKEYYDNEVVAQERNDTDLTPLWSAIANTFFPSTTKHD
jgi:hypothetical protein